MRQVKKRVTEPRPATPQRGPDGNRRARRIKLFGQEPVRLWERLPDPSTLANLARRLFQRKRRIIIPPYSTHTRLVRRLTGLTIFPILFFFFLIYGFFFALTAPFLIAEFAMPIFAVLLLVVWALPQMRDIPSRTMRGCFYAFLVFLALWPNYLAIALPGLPWITLIRTAAFPMLLCLLICLSTSVRFRYRVGEVFNSIPIAWKALAVFALIQFLTLPLSKRLGHSVNLTLINQINWTAVCVVSAYTFSKEGRLGRCIALICIMAIPVAVIAALEFRAQAVLWANYVPSFLKIEDADLILQSKFRPGSGEYRTKSVWSTPLGLAEYMAVISPFLIHAVLIAKSMARKAAAVVILVLSVVAIEASGSRLGYAGIMAGLLAYGLIWAVLRWRRLPGDLIAPALVVAYPFGAALFIGASFTVNRINEMVWGGGAQQSSTQARIDQFNMALPKIAANPLGYGAGNAGSSMGYAEGSFITVDNFWITVTLDYGVLGMLSYYTLFISCIAVAFHYAIKTAGKTRDSEATYLVPLGVAVLVFVVIKFVFSQRDLDPLLFTFVGMIFGIIYRLKREEAAGSPSADNALVRSKEPALAGRR